MSEVVHLDVHLYRHRHSARDIPTIPNTITDARRFLMAKPYIKRLIIAEGAFVSDTEAAKTKRLVKYGFSLLDSRLLFGVTSSLLKRPELAKQLALAQAAKTPRVQHKIALLEALDQLKSTIKFDFDIEHIPDHEVAALQASDKQEIELRKKIQNSAHKLATAPGWEELTDMMASTLTIAGRMIRRRNQAYAEIICGYLANAYQQKKSAAVFVPVGGAHIMIPEHIRRSLPEDMPQPQFSETIQEGRFFDSIERSYQNQVELNDEFYDRDLARQALAENLYANFLMNREGLLFTDALQPATLAICEKRSVPELLNVLGSVTPIRS